MTAVVIAYLFRNRPDWISGRAVGKTIASSGIIDRVTTKLGCKLVEAPVGFKWFVDGVIDGSFGFAGEESAGGVVPQARRVSLDHRRGRTDFQGCLRPKSPREPSETPARHSTA